METRTKNIIIVIAILVILLASYDYCHRNDTTPKYIKVTHPEVKGSTPISNVEKQQIVSKPEDVYKNNILDNATKKELDYWKSEVQKLLAEKNKLIDNYQNSSVEDKTILYKEAVDVNSYIKTWDNDTLNATVKGLVAGTIKDMQLKYKIKPKTDSVKLKQVYLRFLAGGEIGINKELNQGTYEVNLSLQDKNSNIYSGSYQQLAGQNYYLFGVQKSIFSLKK